MVPSDSVGVMPINPRISVNTMCLSPDTRLDDDCDWIRSIGVERISISTAKLDAIGWEPGIAAVRASGLKVATVVSPVMFQLDDPSGWAERQALGLRTIDAAAAMGAESIYGVTGPPGRLSWEEGAAAYLLAVAPLRTAAEAAGVRLALEPTNPLRISLNLCHSLRDVVELAEMTGVGACIDLYGCFGEAHLDETIRRAAGNTALVQVCDFVYGTLDTPNRAVPGDGDLALGRILGWILDSGYEGPFDLELNGPRIDAEGHRAASERGAVALTELLASLGG
jgi:sugar phosphate isomerase/epimerase